MCGRYVIEDSVEMQEFGNEMMRSALVQEWNKLYNIKLYGEMCPTDIVPVIAVNRNLKRSVFPMKWGFSGQALLINARVETAAVKPTFKEAWKRHRCIVPASYYYEWEHLRDNSGRIKTGDRYAIQPKESSVTWLCGLYRFEGDLPYFVILTREPGDRIRFLHDRMPLIMPDHLVNDWINPEADPDMLLREAVTDVIAEKQERKCIAVHEGW